MRLEFYQLREEDRKVMFWLMKKAPKRIRSFAEYIAREYSTTGFKVIDAEKLNTEIAQYGSILMKGYSIVENQKK